MKRGAEGEENGKKLNSTTNESQEDTTHVIYGDPFVDQYEEEEFVEDNEDEDKVEELNGEEEETERHDVCGTTDLITVRYSKSERTRWRKESAWSTITAPTACTTV